MIETISKDPRFASEDILCYKLVYVKPRDRWIDGSVTKCESSVFGVIYDIGEETWQEELKLEGPYNDVTSGYPLFWNVTSGFASYKDKPVPYSEGMYVAECVIPRGQTYYEDQSGTCYASSKIKIINVIE